MKIKRYLPIVLCLILVSCMLSSCTSPENTGTPDSGFSVEQVAYGSCKWGMTEEEVLQALSLSEDQVTDGGTDQSGGHANPLVITVHKGINVVSILVWIPPN